MPQNSASAPALLSDADVGLAPPSAAPAPKALPNDGGFTFEEAMRQPGWTDAEFGLPVPASPVPAASPAARPITVRGAAPAKPASDGAFSFEEGVGQPGRLLSDAEVGLHPGAQGWTDEEFGLTPAAGRTSGTVSDVAKAVPSGLAVGTAALAGTPGSILDAIGNASEYGLQRLAKWSGLAPATAQPQSYSDIAAGNRALTKGTDILPRTEDVLQAARDDAGFVPYEPKTPAGQFLGKTAEYLPGALVGPGGLATKGALAVGSAAGDITAGGFLKGTTLEPYLRTAGAVVGGGLGALTVHGASAIAPAFSNAAARRQAAGMFDASMHDPVAVRAAAAADAGTGEIVPGSKPTSFQRFGDVGLGDVERAVQTRDPQQFVSNPYGTGTQQQNAAQVAAMRGVQSGGDAMSVPDLFLSQKRGLEDLHDFLLEQAERDARGQADHLGGTSTPGQIGAAIKGVVDPQFRTAQGEARSSAAALGGTDTVDAYGAGLRGYARAAADASSDQYGRLFDAVPPDMTLSMAPVQQRAASLYNNMGPALAKTLAPAERDVLDVLGQYGSAAVPFSEARDLDTLLTSSMRAAKAAGQNVPYGRLAQLKGAWESALGSALNRQAGSDAAAVSAGTMDPSATVSARLQAVTGDGGVAGAPSVAFTPSGRKIGTSYGVVDLGDLTASHGPDGVPNPVFPPELQPRDRSRPASQAQVAGMAANLQPERLGYSTSTVDGAPIIDNAGTVESGNGRVMALAKAYGQNGPQAAAYRSWLAGQGYDLDGIARPVLVRQRTTDLSPADRIALARESNSATALTMSAPEQAAADAGRLSDATLSAHQGGDLTSRANQGFVRSWMAGVSDPAERGAMVGPGGALSTQGAQRVRNSLLHAGYGDSSLVSSLAETGDPDIARFGQALSDNAGGMAQLRRGIASGDVHPGADLSAPAVEAARTVQRARSTGQRLADVVGQADAFNPLSEDAKAVLRAGYGSAYDGRLNRGRLSSILADALDEAKQQTAGGRLFDEPLTARQMIEGATARHAGSDEAPRSAAAGAPGAGQGDGAARAEGRGPGPAAVGPGSAAPGGRGVLPAAGEPVTAEAADALSKAKAAFKEHVATFRKGPVGALLRSDGTADGYKMADNAVPAGVFAPGAKGYATVTAYRQAVGNSPGAADMLHNYAASRRPCARPRSTTTAR